MKTNHTTNKAIRILALLLLGLAAGTTGCDRGSSEPNNASEVEITSPESQQAAIKPEDKPQLVALVLDADKRAQFANQEGKPTQPVFLQSYVYDTNKNESAAAGGGTVITLKEVPIRMSLSFGHNFSGGAGTIFGNTFFDLSELWADDWDSFVLGILYTTDGKRQAFVEIQKSAGSKVFINNEYLVYADETKSVSKGGPFATIRWKTKDPNLTARVMATRAGRTIVDTPLSAATAVSVDVSHCTRTNDVVEWKLKGQQTSSGLVAFPVRGATRGVVVYEIEVK